MATLRSSSMLLHCLLSSTVFAEKLAVTLTEAPCMWYITFTFFQNPLSLFLLVVDFAVARCGFFFFFSLSYLKYFISNLGSLGLLFLQIGFLLFFFFSSPLLLEFLVCICWYVRWCNTSLWSSTNFSLFCFLSVLRFGDVHWLIHVFQFLLLMLKSFMSF